MPCGLRDGFIEKSYFVYWLAFTRSRNFQPCIKSENPLLYSQERDIGPYPEPAECILRRI